MPNMKSQRRTKTRELKYTGLPLPIRARLAKNIVRGDSYKTVGLLCDAGATVVSSWGYECCDSHATKEWDYKGKRFATDNGLPSRSYSEFVQKRHAESLLPKPVPSAPIVPPIDVKAIRASFDAHRLELLAAQAKVEDLQASVNRTGDMLVRAVKPNSPSWLEHGTWDCSKSPTGFCVYDDMGDPIHDFCLFCGKPEERK